MYKICCLNNIAKVGTDHLGEGYEFVSEPEGADALMVRSANLHEMELADGLLAIARAGAGVNNIPVERCAEQGVVVFNTPGANANAVKELVICGMLLACRDVIGGAAWVAENSDDPEVGKKAEKAKKQFGGCELAGKSVGVVGLGAIGAAVANSLIDLGCEVMGYDPYLSINAAWSLDRRIEHVTDLGEMLSRCDFVTLHVPATDATRKMMSAEMIARMPRGAVLLNFARDLLVDEQALAEALDDGRVGRYVTDFANPASANMRNAIVLPHLGASTGEAEDNCAVMAANELKDYLENGNIRNSVNYGQVDLGPVGEGDERVAIFHENVQGVIGLLSATLAASGLNIENMTNKSRGGNAYTLFQTFVSAVVRFQEDGTQRRTQGQGVQSRETDGNRHGQTELTVESTCRTSHEAHGNEYGHHHQRNGDDGTTQFTHGVDGSCTGRFVALVQLGMDALDDDDGIVDHNRNGKHHGRKGQQVDTEANQFQYKEGGNQRHGNGDGGNQRGAHILQEDIHYDEHQDKGLDQCLDYLMYGSEEEVVGTLCNVYLQAGGQFAGIVVQ